MSKMNKLIFLLEKEKERFIAKGQLFSFKADMKLTKGSENICSPDFNKKFHSLANILKTDFNPTLELAIFAQL